MVKSIHRINVYSTIHRINLLTRNYRETTFHSDVSCGVLPTAEVQNLNITRNNLNFLLPPHSTLLFEISLESRFLAKTDKYQSIGLGKRLCDYTCKYYFK